MKSLYNDEKASEFKTDLDLRVYTSRLLGQDSSLVLHGGGNTSVKSAVTNLFGESEDILYVKGSGWDLATIKAEGFAPVKMDTLLKMAELKELSDTDMVKYQRVAMIDPSAPNPSVEAILHAIIPFKYVDHTHADAVVTITNTQNAEDKIREIYGDKVLIIPYIMPGFVLAKLVYEMTRDVDWSVLDGMVLMNHGLFTFSEDAKKSYEKTIELVDAAEKYLVAKGATLHIEKSYADIELLELAKIRKEVSNLKGRATISVFNDTPLALHFSKQDLQKIAIQGPLTPDHVIRTKRVPTILGDNFKEDLANYVKEYKQYFEDNKTTQTLLNPAPNFAILKAKGSLSFGADAKEANIIKDINEHTYEAILKAEMLGGYKALSAADIFEVEYWSLEQAKLKKGTTASEFGGKIAVVTGAASKQGIEIVKMLNSRGAAVVALDIKEEVVRFAKSDIITIKCNLECDDEVQKALEVAVKSFGGVDILVSCTNLQIHKKVLKHLSPFLEVGVEPAIVVIGLDYVLREDRDLKIKANPNNIAKMVCTMATNLF